MFFSMGGGQEGRVGCFCRVRGVAVQLVWDGGDHHKTEARLGVLQLVVLLLLTTNEAVLLGLWGNWERQGGCSFMTENRREEISKVISACGFAFAV